MQPCRPRARHNYHIVATRRQWEYKPNSIRTKLLSGRDQLPIINVSRFKHSNTVEVRNHRPNIDTAAGKIRFLKSLALGLFPTLALLILSAVLYFPRPVSGRYPVREVEPGGGAR